MRVGAAHALNAGSALGRHPRRRMKIEVVGYGVGNFKPTEHGLGISRFDHHTARRRPGGRFFWGRLLCPLRLFFGRSVFEHPSVPTVDNIDATFFVNCDTGREIELAFGDASVSPGTEKCSVAVEFLDPMI